MGKKYKLNEVQLKYWGYRNLKILALAILDFKPRDENIWAMGAKAWQTW